MGFNSGFKGLKRKYRNLREKTLIRTFLEIEESVYLSEDRLPNEWWRVTELACNILNKKLDIMSHTRISFSLFLPPFRDNWWCSVWHFLYVIDSAVLFRYIPASGVACCTHLGVFRQCLLPVDVADQMCGWTTDRYTNPLVRNLYVLCERRNKWIQRLESIDDIWRHVFFILLWT